MFENKVEPVDGGDIDASAKASTPSPDETAGTKLFEYGHLSPDSTGEPAHMPPSKQELFFRNFSPDSAGEPVPTPVLTSVRFRLALVTWFGFAVLYAQRTNLSIAMVCMVKGAAHNTSQSLGAGEESKYPELAHSDLNEGGFEWSKALQGQILGSFFYGYLVMQLPGGMLSERFGAKHVVTCGMLPMAILTLLTPVAARVHYVALIVTRIVIGIGQSVMYPAVTSLWGRWSPPLERSMLVGIAMSGGQFGNAFALPVSGLLCAEVGWDSIFYVLGGLGLVFVLLWMLWASATPAQHKGLSKEELTYLERTVPTVSFDKKRKTPWKAIFTSPPFWAIVVAHQFGNYTYYMNLTQIPTYMKEVLKFNIKSNGVFSMLPYLVFWLSTVGAGVLSDFIIHKNVPMIVVRKIFAILGLVGPAAFLVATAYIDYTEKYLAVFTLCCSVGFTGFGFASYLVNHADLAPDLAGTLFGLTNTVGTLPGFIAPIIVGIITPDGTAEQWRKAFFVAAAINTVAAVFYGMFASAEQQPWSEAAVKEKKSSTDEELKEAVVVYMPPSKVEEMKIMKKQSTVRRMSSVTPM